MRTHLTVGERPTAVMTEVLPRGHGLPPVTTLRLSQASTSAIELRFIGPDAVQAVFLHLKEALRELTYQTVQPFAIADVILTKHDRP